MQIRVRTTSDAADTPLHSLSDPYGDAHMTDAEAAEADDALPSDVVVVTPGEVISTASGAFLRGHGTYLSPAGDELVASVAGVVEKVNQLISVRPLVARYMGEVGDIVVGRVAAVGAKRWAVDVNGQQHAALVLSAVTLPGGAQRRRTYADQLQMRSLFVESDLISAEVQEVRYDGSLSLHTRSLRYGKLENGQFAAVAPALVKRMKQHMVSLPSLGVDLVLGTNGYIWISRSLAAVDDEATAAAAAGAGDSAVETRVEILAAKRQRHADTPTSADDRRAIARVYRALLLLNERFRLITPERILATCAELEAQEL